MPAAPDARHAAFARFVKRACDHARLSRGWGPTRVAQEAGISRSTLFRWLKGDMERDPTPAHVVMFCDALDIPPAAAFKILWPGKTDKAAQPEPLPMDPDFEVLLRRLEDPGVSETEKYHIRETIRALAARSVARPRLTNRDAG